MHQLLAEGGENTLLQDRATEAGAVGTAIMAVGWTAEIVLAVAGEGPATDAADKLASQQMPGTAAVSEPGDRRLYGSGPHWSRLGRQARPDTQPKVCIDDAQLRHFMDDMRAFLGIASHIAARDRVLDRKPATPDKAADIGLIVRDGVRPGKSTYRDIGFS